MDVSGKRVFVGLSGGVDSAVSAALLVRAGAKATGVFIKGWYPPGMPCTWAEDRRDAMRVAARLGIPFLTLDAAAAYKQGVIDYLLAEYAAGRTPNPDVMCNREVKFGAFHRFAKERGAGFIATGHYARREGESLFRGLDGDKDQSYFLWAVPAEALAHTLFPVGALHKREVRAHARRFGLPNAAKRDSQGICFLGSISVEEFLSAEFGAEEGVARDEDGREVGRHAGAVLPTIGQRVALAGAAPGPWYVLRKDIGRNELVVARGQLPRAGAGRVALSQTNWLGEAAGELEAQYRYHGPRVRGVLSAGRAAFIPAAALPEPVAAGQSLVLYDGDRCLGGGVIAADGIIG
jgi:tRNA-specific 2-thiouridylase